MKIHYLWVDSLCIIQTEEDNAQESDKDRELAKMAYIYTDAVLTICASCSTSAKEGFLQDREVWPPGIALPVRVNDRYDIAQLFAVPELFGNKLEPEPVDQRAWIFQEQTLSKQVLNFRKCGMQLGHEKESIFFSQDDNYNFNNNVEVGITLPWTDLIEEYTRRDLTVLEDRSIAIAGVAERFAKKKDFEGDFLFTGYLAGIWESDLLNGLLWFVPSSLEEDNDGRGNIVTRMEGPSWSWTTISGPIAWHYSSYEVKSTVTIIRTTVDLVEPSFIYGAAKSGRIRLKGLITRSPLTLPDIYEDFECHMDCETEPEEVFLLELTIRDSFSYVERRFERWGLLLRVAERPGEFTRAGTFSERIYDGCESLRGTPCLVHRDMEECTCEDLPLGCNSCGCTCDREESIIDII